MKHPCWVFSCLVSQLFFCTNCLWYSHLSKPFPPASVTFPRNAMVGDNSLRADLPLRRHRLFFCNARGIISGPLGAFVLFAVSEQSNRSLHIIAYVLRMNHSLEWAWKWTRQSALWDSHSFATKNPSVIIPKPARNKHQEDSKSSVYSTTFGDANFLGIVSGERNNDEERWRREWGTTMIKMRKDEEENE